MNYDKNDLATCYDFLTNKEGVITKKVKLLEMNARGWSTQFVERALSEGYGKAIELTPRLNDHGIGYYDVTLAE